MVESPQIEDGHTDIANELMEALAKIRISGEAMQVLLVIFRKTYGWHKKEDAISLSQFMEGTGLKKPIVCRAIKKLSDMNLIVIKKDNAVINNDNSHITSYCFNKHYKSWKPLSKKITLSKKIIGVIKKDNLALSKKIPTKETITKETITKEKNFAQFWELYPLKKGKEKAREKWNTKVISDEMALLVIEAVKKQLHADMFDLTEKKKYCPHPATWLHQGRWEDEIITHEKPIEDKHDSEPVSKPDTVIL